MTDKRVDPMSQHEASLAWLLTSQCIPAPQPFAQDWISGEPDLQDLMADPLVHAVLRRDGLGLQDLRRAIALGRSRLTSARQHHSATNAA